jgi:hypothetical protein
MAVKIDGLNPSQEGNNPREIVLSAIGEPAGAQDGANRKRASDSSDNIPGKKQNLISSFVKDILPKQNVNIEEKLKEQELKISINKPKIEKKHRKKKGKTIDLSLPVKIAKKGKRAEGNRMKELMDRQEEIRKDLIWQERFLNECERSGEGGLETAGDSEPAAGKENPDPQRIKPAKDNNVHGPIKKFNTAASYLRFALAVNFSGFVFIILFYSLVSLLTLEFKFNNAALEGFSRVLPIPALVCRYGIIDYFDYQKLKVWSDPAARGSKDAEFIKILILENLGKRYMLPRTALATQEGIKSLEDELLRDDKINYVSLSRIRKLVEGAKEADFLPIAAKYAESVETLDITPAAAAEIFGERILRMREGEVSDVIYLDDAYAVVKVMKNSGDTLSLIKATVKATTLEEYLNKEISSLKVWNLAGG